MTQREILKKIVDNRPTYTWRPSPEDLKAGADPGEVILENDNGDKCCRQQPWKNGRGNTVHPGSDHTERYKYDRICSHKEGWVQYDTDQDAWYFGVWVHVGERLIFTYCEGDISLVTCETEESFQAELKNMAECYGPPPPMFKVIGDNFTAKVYTKEGTFGRELPEGVVTETRTEATKLVLGGGE